MRCFETRYCRYQIWIVLLIMLNPFSQAGAVSQLKQYEKAPVFNLPTINPDAEPVGTESLKGKTAILVFGELYNRNTISALEELETASEKIRFSDKLDKSAPAIYLIVAQNIPDEQLQREQAEKKSMPLFYMIQIGPLSPLMAL